MSTRLEVKKTYKLYIGGKFPRSESGRYLPAQSAKGEHLDNFAHASRKDFRDAVVAARAATDGWAKATAYLRGQILSRTAEMLQNRAHVPRPSWAVRAAASRNLRLRKRSFANSGDVLLSGILPPALLLRHPNENSSTHPRRGPRATAAARGLSADQTRSRLRASD